MRLFPLRFRPLLLALPLLSVTVATGSTAAMATDAPDRDTATGAPVLVLELEHGKVLIRTRPDLAPAHVARITELARTGFYDGLAFHRVIPGFVAQTGDPAGNGTGGSGKKLDAEFSDAPHLRGTVSMARASDPDSADSQFFICLGDARFLDGAYTVWGEVTSGMEYVDMIRAGDRQRNGMVSNPDRIIRLRPAGDSGL